MSDQAADQYHDDTAETPEPEQQVWGDDSDELRESLAAAQAELANTKSRRRKDLETQFEAGRTEIISALLPVLDSINGARDHGDLDEDNPLTPVIATLERALSQRGVETVGETDEPFDPTVHEALHVEVDDDVQVTTVSKVLQRGYTVGDRLLRPAKVTVRKAGRSEA